MRILTDLKLYLIIVNMIPRHLKSKVLKYAKEYPILALVGPRQSGKTTLVKSLFPKYTYISLENIDYRNRASKDPRGFLSDFGPNLILDEAQRVPELFAYLQELVDLDESPAQYVLTGSSQFLLIEKITQSLAGRIITFKLYPLTYTELQQYRQDTTYDAIFQKIHPNQKVVSQLTLYEIIWKGMYPKVHAKKIDSYKWYENYLLTYVERDVRSLLNIKNLRMFEQFLLICASQSGQLINYANISNALGVSLATVKEWVSILETSGLIFILPPYFKNFSKRVVKAPKLYFVDTGLLCHLLSIRTIDQLKVHPLLGYIFETFIVSECFKRFHNIGERPPLYFWNDQSQNEIDLLIDTGASCFPIEIKLSQSFNPDFKKTMMQWMQLKGNKAEKGLIIYCGKDQLAKREAIRVTPWYLL